MNLKENRNKLHFLISVLYLSRKYTYEEGKSMFSNLKRKSVTRSLFGIILCIVFGIVLIVFQFGNIQSLLKGPVKFESLSPEEIQDGVIVEASINTNFSWFAEEYEEDTNTHRTTSEYFYYVIWTGDDEATDWRYMGIKVPASDADVMDAMAEAYYNGEYFDTTMEYAGTIREMTDEEYSYFRDFFREGGWTDEEIASGTLPYYIDEGALVGGAAVFPYLLTGVGAVLVLGAIVFFILLLCGSGLKAIKKELADVGITESEAEFEYENAKIFTKNNDVRIGRRVLFYMSGSKAHIISKDKIVWAYMKTTTHRTNGIKTGTTYEVAVYTYDKKSVLISVNKENIALEILQYIGDTMPWVVVGYNDDLNRLFRGNYSEFLELRYNSASTDTTYQTTNPEEIY